MSMFTLAISCLTTSNLPWFLDLHFRFLCKIVLTASDLASITSHIHSWVLFSLWLHLFILSGVIFHWSPVAYLAPTNLESSSFSVLFFAFSYCSWGSQGKKTEVVCHSLLQWTTFCQTSTPWSICLGWSYTAWLSFLELDKAVVHVIRLVSFLWLWFQSVCPLTPSLRAYPLTGVSLPWTWGISSQLLTTPVSKCPTGSQTCSITGSLLLRSQCDEAMEYRLYPSSWLLWEEESPHQARHITESTQGLWLGKRVYWEEREDFWHKHQKWVKENTLTVSLSRALYTFWLVTNNGQKNISRL